MEAEMRMWIEKMEHENLSKKDVEIIRTLVDKISNKDDQSELEIELLSSWVLLEMEQVENDENKINLSWATPLPHWNLEIRMMEEARRKKKS
jgi:hypothetical protein